MSDITTETPPFDIPGVSPDPTKKTKICAAVEYMSQEF